LTEEERRYPIGLHFPNLPLLIDWIEKRYRTRTTMADRRRPSSDLLLALDHRTDMSGWQAGRAFLDPLFAEPVLAPARVSLDEKPLK